MKKPYKDKVTNMIDSCNSRVNQLSYMIDGKKPANTTEAKKYINEIRKGLQMIQEMVDIS